MLPLQISRIRCEDTNLSGGEGQAHGADGLGVLVRLLLHLQQLRRLDERLQSLLGAARHQAFVPEPLLQLADVVPATAEPSNTVDASSRGETILPYVSLGPSVGKVHFLGELVQSSLQKT